MPEDFFVLLCKILGTITGADLGGPRGHMPPPQQLMLFTTDLIVRVARLPAVYTGLTTSAE